MQTNQQSQNDGQKSMGARLDDLPKSEDKFWELAEVHTNIVPERVTKDDNHYFVRIPGHQAQCNHCDWGFQLDPGDKIVDGHLYDRKGTLVI